MAEREVCNFLNIKDLPAENHMSATNPLQHSVINLLKQLPRKPENAVTGHTQTGLRVTDHKL